MNSLTRPALEIAKTMLESIAAVQAAFDAGSELDARRLLKRLAAQAPHDIAVMDSAMALLDEAEAIVSRSLFARVPCPANDLQDQTPPSAA